MQLRNNVYDEDEVEYWVDYRTTGVRGTEERDGLLEKKEGDTSGIVSTATDLGKPISLAESHPAGLQEETGQKAGPYWPSGICEVGFVVAGYSKSQTLCPGTLANHSQL